jgi:hypothetical protein
MEWSAAEVIASYNEWVETLEEAVTVEDEGQNHEDAVKVAEYLNLYEKNTFNRTEAGKIFDAAAVLRHS